MACQRRLATDPLLISRANDSFVELLFCIRLVHGRNLPRNRRPFELPADRLSAFDLLHFLPFQELVSKPKVGLDDYIEAACTDVAAEAGQRSARRYFVRRLVIASKNQKPENEEERARRARDSLSTRK